MNKGLLIKGAVILGLAALEIESQIQLVLGRIGGEDRQGSEAQDDGALDEQSLSLIHI